MRRVSNKRSPAVCLRLAYCAVAALSSVILDGLSLVVFVSALDSTDVSSEENQVIISENLQIEDGHIRIESMNFVTDGQDSFLRDQRRSKSSELLTRIINGRRLVKDNKKMLKGSDRYNQQKMETKPEPLPLNRSLSKSNQTTWQREKKQIKAQMIRARLDKRAAKKQQKLRQKEGQHLSVKEKFVGELEHRLHQQFEGGRGKSDWHFTNTGKPSGRWDNNRWSRNRPGSSRYDGNFRDRRSYDWKSDRWGPRGDFRRSGGGRPRREWSGNENWSKPCKCRYIHSKEQDRSSWNWNGSSWIWGGQMKKFCTCQSGDKSADFPTFHPTTELPLTNIPTYVPTRYPSADPTLFPTLFPTREPTLFPTQEPALFPTLSPTQSDPTISPTYIPTLSPSLPLPTLSPSISPTLFPTISPTHFPTLSPSKRPTISPTDEPTSSPTYSPSKDPTTNPTFSPSRAPTFSPSKDPTTNPTFSPTATPTISTD